jgi:transposase-like protein
VLERLNQELKRRTHVIRIFPNPESCLRLIRALAEILSKVVYRGQAHPC